MTHKKSSKIPKKKSAVPADERKNPWTTLKVREVFSTKWIQVTERDVLNPAGNPSKYGVVHFRNVAVGAMTIDERERVLLVGQFRYTLDQYSWEIPEGGCPEGTDELETARRELKEETGFTAKRWSHLLTMHLSNSCTDERAEVFLAQGLTPGEPEPEETERLKTKWVSRESALKMVKDGEITDAISVAAILRWAASPPRAQVSAPAAKRSRVAGRRTSQALSPRAKRAKRPTTRK